MTEQSKEHPHTAPLRVLLVEDSIVLQERLRELLEFIPGVAVIDTAVSESAAVEVVRSRPVDAMILDLRLKQGTGFGVLRALAKLPHRAVAIVLTNYALPQYRREAMALGVRYFLDKSCEFDQLASVLREVADARKSAGP